MTYLNLLFMVVPRPIFLDALKLLVGLRALPFEQHPVGYRYELNNQCVVCATTQYLQRKCGKWIYSGKVNVNHLPKGIIALLDCGAMLNLEVLGRHENVSHELVAVLQDVVQRVAARPALVLETFKPFIFSSSS